MLESFLQLSCHEMGHLVWHRTLPGWPCLGRETGNGEAA